MTGIDKPFANLAGQPLIAHVITRSDPFFNIKAPADLDEAERLIAGVDGQAD